MARDLTVVLDLGGLKQGFGRLRKGVEKSVERAVSEIANEVLRLSQMEVPHDTGALQTSGHVADTRSPKEKIVGYNKVYAAKLHEHPEFTFQKGRKGKYLEDPIKHNFNVFRDYYKKIVGGFLR